MYASEDPRKMGIKITERRRSASQSTTPDSPRVQDSPLFDRVKRQLSREKEVPWSADPVEFIAMQIATNQKEKQ